MTPQKAKEIFTAMAECYRRKCSCEYHCDDCESCELMYAQGTMGEIREACYLVVGILDIWLKAGEDCDHCIYKTEADDNGFDFDICPYSDRPCHNGFDCADCTIEAEERAWLEEDDDE